MKQFLNSVDKLDINCQSFRELPMKCVIQILISESQHNLHPSLSVSQFQVNNNYCSSSKYLAELKSHSGTYRVKHKLKITCDI